jgi:hypothetical protein
LLSKEPSIIHLLDSTGQVGVLVHVNIQKLQGETPIYSVVGNDVSILGAGTSPSAVNLAYRQLDHLEVTTARGAIVDLDKSYFLWFSRADRALTAEMRSARGVISESARAFADDKILQSINKANDVAALGAAAAHLEKAMSDQRLRENLANLRQKQVDDEAKIKSIEEDLAKALDKARRAQATAATLTMISSAMTLASQIGTAVASLGQDAPPGLERASSPAELMNMVNDIALSADSSASRLRIEYKSHLNSRTDTRTEILSILRQSRYPISEVPQIIP